jgi:hypothetical protein
MAAAISAADRSLDLVISFSIWQAHYSGCLITRRAFEPRYSGTRQPIFEHDHASTRLPARSRRTDDVETWIPGHRRTEERAAWRVNGLRLVAKSDGPVRGAPIRIIALYGTGFLRCSQSRSRRRMKRTTPLPAEYLGWAALLMHWEEGAQGRLTHEGRRQEGRRLCRGAINDPLAVSTGLSFGTPVC